jgi:hypothetical protein
MPSSRTAYDALGGAMKQRLAGLVGLHGRHDGPAGVKLYEGDPEQNLDRKYTEKARPAVIHHTVTGRPVLFVNPLHTHGFEGMAKEDAWQLIEALAAPNLIGVDNSPQHHPAFVGPVVAGAAMHCRLFIPYQHVANAPRVVINEPFLCRMLAARAPTISGRDT